MQAGKLVILSGPSGVGKDTVLDAWIVSNPKVKRVVTYTTRSPRSTEVNGNDYHFVTLDQFQEFARNGHFLEFKEVHGNWYASPLKDLDEMLSQGLIPVLKIDVQGALSAMKLRPDATTIFILPPSEQELESRILGRGTETPEAISTRLENARKEIALSQHYQHKLVNTCVEQTVAALEEIVNERLLDEATGAK